MRNVVRVLSCLALLLMPVAVFAQDERQAGTGAGAGSGSGQSGSKTSSTTQSRTSVTTKTDDAPQVKFVRTLTNVQVELTLTDQAGGEKPDKKTVSMVVSSGNWGKIRSAGAVRQGGDAPFGVDLGVDARPFVSMDGQIQLELTLNYSPPGALSGNTRNARPTGVNQSMTVVLQSGKPLIVSQAADPVSDRKVVVEVKATVLK